MTIRHAAPTSAAGAVRRADRLVLVAIGIVIAASLVALGGPWASWAAGPIPGGLRGDAPELITEADGLVPDDASVFDDGLPAVANLDADLLEALRRAATDADADGVEFEVNSGWRSAAYQEHLLHEAVAEHGSAEEAARWVAPATTSAHVAGDAVDIGPVEAATWLADHGARYGLCRVYRNEPWHVELRPDAARDGCPRMYADPTQDPRLQP